MSYLTMRLGPDRLWALRTKEFQIDGLIEHSPRSPDFNYLDIAFWTMAERHIWYKPRDQVPQNLEELQQKLEEFCDLCNENGSVQQKEIFNGFYGIEDSLYNNQRRGGLIGRFFLGAQNGGEALDGTNKRKERHAAELPPNWREFSGQLVTSNRYNCSFVP